MQRHQLQTADTCSLSMLWTHLHFNYWSTSWLRRVSWPLLRCHLISSHV